MVIEQFRDSRAVHQRFVRQGRMMPDGVRYLASWIDPAESRCFQVMEAEHAEALRPWLARWADLVDFQVVPVVESSAYWEKLGS